MADVETALYTILSGDAGVTALISTRMYPVVIPQDVSLPAVAYQRISTARVYSHDGPSCLARPRFQFSCTATTYSAARAVANAIRAALDGYNDTANGVRIMAAFTQNEFDGFTDTDDLWTVYQDYFVWHVES